MAQLTRFILLRLLVIAAIAFVVVVLASGCAASRQAARGEGPVAEFRMPPAETVDIRLLREQSPRPPAPVPPSVSDESAGRWLTLFQINVTPSEAAGVPPPTAESP